MIIRMLNINEEADIEQALEEATQMAKLRFNKKRWSGKNTLIQAQNAEKIFEKTRRKYAKENPGIF